MMRWLRIVDVETSGMDPATDDVVELGQCVVSESALDSTDSTAWTVASYHESCLFTPRAPLSPEVRAIHGLEMRDLPAALPFREFGHNAWEWRGRPGSEAAIACHKADFDSQFIGHLAAGAPFLCTYKCALRLWPDAPSHGNNALRYWLQDQHKWPIDTFIRGYAEPPHRAGPDAYVTAHLVVALLREVPLETLLVWSAEPRQLVKMPMGKHRGERFDALPTDYLTWILRSDMDVDIKTAARAEMDRRAEARP